MYSLFATFRRNRLILAFLAGAATWSAARADESVARTDDAIANFRSKVQPLMKQLCYRCHGDAKQEANLHLGRLNTDLVVGSDAEAWHDVLNKINLGEMPPEDEPQPTEEQRKVITQWITAELKRAAAAKKSTSGRTVLRRLNRYEYNNTLRDLLGFELDFASDLPPDPPSEQGFKNNGVALRMSPLQVEYYLQAARRAMRKAIVVGPAPDFIRHRADKTESLMKNETGRVDNRLSANVFYAIRLEQWPTEGEVLLRIKAAAVESDNVDPPRIRALMGVRTAGGHPAGILGEADVTSVKPQTFEFRGRMEEFPLPGHKPMYPHVSIRIHNCSDGVPKPRKSNKNRDVPLVDILSVEFEGPFWPPESHKRILFPSKNSAEEDKYAREVLERFLPRAYRRPVKEADLKPLLTLFRAVRPRVETFEHAMREVLSMALVSPDFLYLRETQDGPRGLSDFEFASRLSYFLWSTMPDEQLFELAGSGRLRDPDVLEKHVHRMIADSRSWQFVEHFTDQWLELSRMRSVAVNPEYHPYFDESLKGHMRKETHHFFAEVLRKDLSCLTIIESDFATLNRPLVQHYGIRLKEGPKTFRFQRVLLDPENHRGGLLTHGSVLLANSNGAESHPVRRAVWLLERILDDAPPPPPPDVPELETAGDADADIVSVKKQLELHRKREACNSCHRGIDPWGVPFEQFNAIGNYRKYLRGSVAQERAKRERKDRTKIPVESIATLPDGHQVNGIEELKAYLVQHKSEEFARSLVKHLLSYALGRSLEFTDRENIDVLTRDFVENDFKLSHLIVAIVRSDAFQSK